jgi:outer membrane protein OmpA-like peptidoglycan-associated protein
MTSFRNSTSLVLLAAALLLGGCSSLSNTEKGAIIGAGAGAAGGAAVGKAAGGTAEGAIIGAVVGGTAGAIIGRRMDKKAEELDEELENADVERVGEGIKVTFDGGLLFDFDSSALRADARGNLNEFAESMRDFEDTNILIVGHTDSKGSEDYNRELSDRRADSAADFLMEQGIAGGAAYVGRTGRNGARGEQRDRRGPPAESARRNRRLRQRRVPGARTGTGAERLVGLHPYYGRSLKHSLIESSYFFRRSKLDLEPIIHTDG